MFDPPSEPTSEQCSRGEIVEEDGVSYLATWYPQMGGYVSKCLVQLEKCEQSTEGAGRELPCFDCYIWHDGDFPFSESGQSPTRIHHCSAEQFVKFGGDVEKAQREFSAKGMENHGRQ